ncbi:MAG: OmpA family protein, partial [Myxococcota bacterium]
NFNFDQAEIRPVSRVVLDAAIDALRRYPNLRVEVAGHTDSTGDATYNQALSERRARAVADYLVSKGIAASRLRVAGYGEGRPIADNSTRGGRAQNRRTELNILP